MKKILFSIIMLLITLITFAQRNSVYKDSSVVEFFRRTSGWTAGDGAFTIPLSDGRTLWIMGDSHIDDYDPATHTIPCLFQVNNAALLQPEGDWNWKNTQTLLPKRKGNKSFFRDTTDEKTYYWPVSGIQLRDTVYVYYNGIIPSGNEMGFAPADKNMLVKIKFPEMEIAGHHRMQDFDGIQFGDGFIKNELDGFVYVYGYKYKNSSIYVARFPADHPTGKWTIWNGKSWTYHPEDAAPIGDITGKNTPMVCKIKDRYILVSSELSFGCDMGKRIYVSVAEKPTGPFLDHKAVYTIDDTWQGHYPFFYVPVAHPQFINAEGELLITYNVNGYAKCIEGCVDNRMNPDHYRPKGIRVPLKVLDPSLD